MHCFMGCTVPLVTPPYCHALWWQCHWHSFHIWSLWIRTCLVMSGIDWLSLDKLPQAENGYRFTNLAENRTDMSLKRSWREAILLWTFIRRWLPLLFTPSRRATSSLMISWSLLIVKSLGFQRLSAHHPFLVRNPVEFMRLL